MQFKIELCQILTCLSLIMDQLGFRFPSAFSCQSAGVVGPVDWRLWFSEMLTWISKCTSQKSPIREELTAEGWTVFTSITWWIKTAQPIKEQYELFENVYNLISLTSIKFVFKPYSFVLGADIEYAKIPFLFGEDWGYNQIVRCNVRNIKQ